MMLTDLTGQLVDNTPPVGHSINGPSTALSTKGSTSSGGASSPTQPSAYKRFMLRRQLQENLLKKATHREQLVDRMQARLDAIDTYLADDEVWFQKLEEAKLRDIAIMEGVYIDKLQLLQGNVTQIIGVQHQEKIDQVLPLLLQAIQQRGLKVEATERKIEMITTE